MFFFLLLVLVISTESPRLAGCDKNSEVEEIVRELCWFISVNSPQDRRSLCVL